MVHFLPRAKQLFQKRFGLEVELLSLEHQCLVDFKSQVAALGDSELAWLEELGSFLAPLKSERSRLFLRIDGQREVVEQRREEVAQLIDVTIQPYISYMEKNDRLKEIESDLKGRIIDATAPESTFQPVSKVEALMPHPSFRPTSMLRPSTHFLVQADEAQGFSLAMEAHEVCQHSAVLFIETQNDLLKIPQTMGEFDGLTLIFSTSVCSSAEGRKEIEKLLLEKLDPRRCLAFFLSRDNFLAHAPLVKTVSLANSGSTAIGVRERRRFHHEIARHLFAMPALAKVESSTGPLQ